MCLQSYLLLVIVDVGGRFFFQFPELANVRVFPVSFSFVSLVLRFLLSFRVDMNFSFPVFIDLSGMIWFSAVHNFGGSGVDCPTERSCFFR